MPPILKTVIDFPTYRDFFFFNLRKRKSFYFILILGILGIVYTGVMIWYYSSKGETLTLNTLLPFIILVAAYFIYFIIFMATAKSSYKKNEETFKTPLLYAFMPNWLEIRIEGAQDKNNYKRVNYDEIKAAYDGEEVIYLILKDKKMLIVKKEFLQGDTMGVAKILMSIPGILYRKIG